MNMNREFDGAKRLKQVWLLAFVVLVCPLLFQMRVCRADDEPPLPLPPPPPAEPEPETEEKAVLPAAAKPKPAAAIAAARQISEGIRWVADQVRPSVVWMRGASLCSGVAVDPDGYILGILGATGNGAVNVTLGGKTYQGKVVASDASADLALVKIDAKNLPVARLGDSDTMQVGDFVLCVGAPFGFPQSVTAGIISYKNRKRKLDTPLLQHSVPMDPNNVGSPLVNVEGEVIGLSRSIAGGNFIGIGYAVPINAFKQKLLKQVPLGKNQTKN